MKRLTYLAALLAVLLLAGCNRHPAVSGSYRPGYSRSAAKSRLAPIPQPQENPQAYAPDPLRHYRRALAGMRAMLEGGDTLSFKDAVFLTENAYHKGSLSYEGFNRNLAGWARFCDSLAAAQDSLYRADQELARQWAVWTFLKDTVLLQSPGGVGIGMLPMQYNHEDSDGHADWASTFVTRLMCTGRGNCRSLPYLYKMLAEELGASAYLILAPNHIYITHQATRPGSGGLPVRKWYNLELTSGSFPSDSWIISAGYVTPDAIRSHTYMHELSDTQSVGQALVDLAQAARWEYGADAAGFAEQCLRLALKAHPENPNARLMLSALLLDAGRKAEAEGLARALVKDGYRYAPDLMYLQWTTASRTEADAGADTSTFHGLFPQRWDSLYGEPVRSVSGGRFDECPECQTGVRVGRMLVDAPTGKITYPQFAETVERMDAALSSRWLSVDPHASSYPWSSPYVAMNNNPVLFFDSDGLDAINGHIKLLQEAKAQLETANAALAAHQANPISRDAPREDRRAYNDRTALLENDVKNARRDVRSQELYKAQVERVLKAFAYYDPTGYNAVDNLTDAGGNKIDVIFMINPSLEKYNEAGTQQIGILGQTNAVGDAITDNATGQLVGYQMRSLSGPNTATIALNPTTGEETAAHESGHARYLVRNYAAYEIWKKANPENVQEGQHGPGDPSGLESDRATEEFRESKRTRTGPVPENFQRP